MKNLFLTLLAAILSMTVCANDYDLNKPFGFCTVSSRTDASSTYNITGGGIYDYAQLKSFNGTSTILKSNGQDMKSTIQNAIKQYDVIIFDGSEGDFIVSENIGFERGNKTLLGINNARLCTQWHMTDEIKTALNQAGVPSMSTSGGGGTLPNGTKVSEEAEYNTRRIIIELTGDNSEKYRKSGIFSLNKENVIIRNITFVGPGSVDVGGYDLISATGAKHCWVDHCAFQDGMDGNFDITNSSDFITVSWCTFSYTDRSYMHQNTNLVGSNDDEPTGFLNTTFAFNWWSTGCNQRMPMARVGKIHMLNNYYTCVGSAHGINPRKNSEFLIEGNYFAKGVTKYYGQNDATAVTWSNTNHAEEDNSRGTPSSIGSAVTVPYEYTVAPYSDVPTTVTENAGATLQFKDDSSEGDVVEKTLYSTNFSDWTKASAAQSASTVVQQTKYSHETLTFTLFNTEVNPAGSNSKFKDGATLGWLMAAKSSNPYITTSKLASITKVRFVHGATGSNRGWKLEAKGDGDADWVTISNTVANPAGWCEVNANINRTNVELRFTNLNSNENAYMFELDIYGNVNMGGTPTLGTIKANGQTYDLSEVFEENASGDMEATVEISKTATMISESNPIEAVADNGTLGTITYTATATSCKVTIPVTANGKTLNYIINFVQKPDFTLTYIDTDGTTMGTQSVEKDAQIGTFDIDIATAKSSSTTKKARGWFKKNSVGEKYTTESIITEDVNLYAVETEIEVASDSKKYTFNLADKNFDTVDHEAFNTIGSGKFHDTTHGWSFSNGDKIELLVGRKASISLGLCQYTADGATITASNGASVNAKTTTDGTITSINYEGDEGTLTLTINATGTVYIHKIIIQNTYTTNYDVIGSWYIVKKDDADSFTEVLDLANNTGGSDPIYIFLPDGTYDLGEKVKTPISRNNISIIGQSVDKTVIMNTPPLSMEGLDKADLLKNTSTNLYMQDLSLKNAMYYDGKTTGRASTLHDQGTQTINKNVRHLSHQDTYYSHKTGGLYYFEGGELHGTVDYLCGNGKVYYNEVKLVNEERSSATITANSELYVFNNCTIENHAGSYNFGRAWSDNPTCIYLNTILEDPSKLIETRWNLEGINCDYKIAGEYGTKDKDGNNITPTSNTITFKKANTTLNTILAESELSKYTIDKVLGTWAATAQQQTKQLSAPTATYDNGTVTWSAVDGASAYALFKNGEFLGITTSNSYNITVDATKDALTIRTANSRGGFGAEAAVAGTVSGINVISNNRTDNKAIYTLQGVRVEKPTKGIYIIGGRKVVFK